MVKDIFGVIVLAAGKGTRMKSDKLKVMHEINGRPMIDYVVGEVAKLNLASKPVVVVCDDDSAVQNYLGARADYAIQKERLGTGHAVLSAEEVWGDRAENVMVLYGDMPFVDADFLSGFMAGHLQTKSIFTLATVKVPSFTDKYQGFYSFGRIVRGIDGGIKKIVEKKDASAEELEIKELNTAIFCFRADWLWKNLKKIKNTNAQKEYYLTDLVGLAFEQQEKISTVEILPEKAVGINTREELEMAEKMKKN